MHDKFFYFSTSFSSLFLGRTFFNVRPDSIEIEATSKSFDPRGNKLSVVQELVLKVMFYTL